MGSLIVLGSPRPGAMPPAASHDIVRGSGRLRKAEVTREDKVSLPGFL